MPRRRGFKNEDYELAQAIDQVAGVPLGTSVPSESCDAAEKWALTKIRARAKVLWDAGYHSEASALYTTCQLIQDGDL